MKLVPVRATKKTCDKAWKYFGPFGITVCIDIDTINVLSMYNNKSRTYYRI